MTDSLIPRLRAKIDDWRKRAKTDARYGVSQSMKSDREYYGPVNAALAVQEFVDELEALLSAHEAQQSTPEAATPAAPETIVSACCRADIRHDGIKRICSKCGDWGYAPELLGRGPAVAPPQTTMNDAAEMLPPSTERQP